VLGARPLSALIGVALFLIPSAVGPGAADAGSGPQPQSIEPLSFSIPFSYRTMEGLQTKMIAPTVTYDHLHDAAWAPDGHMAIAVGSHDTLVGWDATNLTARILRNGTLGNLYGVAWSDDSLTALAVGWNGALVQVQGTSIVDLPPQGTTIWQGAAYVPTAGFLVVGNGGQMFFLDGGTRTAVVSPTTQDLLGVAYSPVLGRALAVGRAGTAVEITPAGAASLVASPVTEDLRAVGFESDTGKGLVAGGLSVLLSYSGGALANETHAAINGSFYDISVTSSAEPAAIAVRNATVGSVFFTNATFSSTILLGSGLAGVESVARSPAAGYAVATGFYGMFVQAWQNGTWTNISAPYRPVFTDGAWRGTGDLALLVGFNGTVQLYNATSNASSAVTGPNTTASLRGVSWAQNGSEAIIVGAYALWKFDAATGAITTPVATPPDLYAIDFRPGGTDALVVGGGGYMATWDGAALTNITTSIAQGLFTVKWHVDSGGNGDYAYAAGANIVARLTPPTAVSTAVRIGTFLSIAFLGDDVWAVGNQHQIQRYDAGNGIWDNVSLPWGFNTTRFTGIVARPSGDGLLLVGNQTCTAFVNLSKVLKFDTGFFADFNGVDYNPVTHEPMFFGPSHLAFSMREGTFPNLAPTVVLSSPLNGSNWTTAQTITFNATSSSDPEDDPLTFSWWDNGTGYLTTGASLVTQLAAGDHTITVFVDDAQGNNVSASVDVHVVEAQFPPVAVIDSPLPSATPADDQDITFSAASSYDPNAADTLSFRWTSDHVGVFGNASIVVVRLPAATHAITLTVTDSTGRSTNVTMFLVVHLGDVPPSPAVSSPRADGAYASNLPIFLDGRGTSDPDSLTLSYVWLADGVEVARGVVNNTTLGSGFHTITLVVSDGTKTAQFVLDITVGGPADVPPRFLTIEPAVGEVLSGTAVFGGTLAVDPVGPDRFVEVRIEGGEWALANGTVRWTIALDTTGLANGPINVTFRASDGANLTAVLRAYAVDNPFINSKPTVSVVTPAPGTIIQSAIEMAGSVDDPDGGNLTVEFRIGTGEWRAANVTGNTWSAPLDLSKSPDGPATIEVRASDGLDVSATVRVTVIVDNAPPPGSGFSDTMLAIVIVAVGAVGAVALVVWRRGRR
jgi:hypothetical protein